MKVAPVSNTSFGVRNALKGVIYIKPIPNGKVQEGIINSALDELEDAEYDKGDVAYIKNMGINPPFESGKDVVKYLEKEDIPIQYGKFSDPKVHACLARNEDHVKALMINERYKNSTSKAEILATAGGIAHEASHAKDNDFSNSIQEELDSLSLNVLTHRSFERKYPGVFDKENGFFFREGVSLYSKLFFDPSPNKAALKERVADVYGHMKAGDETHPASNLAKEIKELDFIA